MWIFTPTAFVSIVAHRNKPGVLLVRARLKGDLERLFPNCKVSETNDADYRFRTELPRGRVSDVIREQLVLLDYPNVKNAIPKVGPVHQLRHRVMNRVWSVLFQAQSEQRHPGCLNLRELDEERAPALERGW